MPALRCDVAARIREKQAVFVARAPRLDDWAWLEAWLETWLETGGWMTLFGW